MKYLLAFFAVSLLGSRPMMANPDDVRPYAPEWVKITKVLKGVEVEHENLPGGKGVVCFEGGDNCTVVVWVYKPDPVPPPDPTALTTGNLESFHAVTASISYSDSDIGTGVYSLEFSYTWTDGTTVNYLLRNNWW